MHQFHHFVELSVRNNKSDTKFFPENCDTIWLLLRFGPRLALIWKHRLILALTDTGILIMHLQTLIPTPVLQTPMLLWIHLPEKTLVTSLGLSSRNVWNSKNQTPHNFCLALELWVLISLIKDASYFITFNQQIHDVFIGSAGKLATILSTLWPQCTHI